MKLKVFDDSVSDGYNLERKEFIGPSSYKKIFTRESPGLLEFNISCRENLYWKFSDIYHMERFESDSRRYFTKGFLVENRINLREFLDKTIFCKVFHVDNENFILTKKHIAPQIFSLLALLVRDFYNTYSIEDIPIKMLKNATTNRMSFNSKDYIFSAFYSYIFLNKEFRNVAVHLMTESYTGRANGPGREFYYFLFEHLTLVDKSGYKKVSNWWKLPEVKAILVPLVEKKFKVSQFGRFLNFLMEE